MFEPDSTAMSIDGRPSGTWGSLDTDFDRRPHGGPSGALLRPDGPAEPHPPVDARRILALDAVRIVGRLRTTAPGPDVWTTARFGREVEYVRAHLRPIRTRQSLVGSFGREAFHVPVLREAGVGAERGLESAVRVAYALRWLELGDGNAHPSWPDLMKAGTAVLAGGRR
jgi:hypothetical protein